MARKGVLAVSLLLNACLLLVVTYQTRRLQEAASLTDRPPTEYPAARAAFQNQRPKSSGTSHGGPAVAFRWEQVESPDYKVYIANMRAIGMPQETIRDIIVADVSKAYAARKAAIHTVSARPFKYWETAERRHLSAARFEEITRKTTELDEEMEAVLNELLGENHAGGWRSTFVDSFNTAEILSSIFVSDTADLDQKLAFLPEAKREQLRAVDKKFEGIEDEIKSLADWNASTKDPAELQKVLERYVQKKTELAQLLTPEEYEQYELSTSWTAENLRRAMVGFNPTEEEFRKIFGHWRAHDENLAVLNATGQKDPGNDHVFAAIKEALGDDRYQEYRKSWWNHDYHELYQLAEDFGLPRQAAGEVQDVKTAAQAQRKRVLGDPTLTEEQRTAALVAIQSEADAAIAAKLGDQAYQQYRAGRGRWIQNLGKK